MTFRIETKIQDVIKSYDEDDVSISDAIQTVFAHNNSSMLVMHWNDIIFELVIDHCMYAVYSQMLEIIIELESVDTDYEFTSSLLSVSLTVKLALSVIDGQLTITPEWYVVPAHVDKGQLLQSKKTLTCTKTKFISEWRRALRDIDTVLEQSGYMNLERY